MVESMDEEQKWALGTLIIFVILLIISGISDFVEVGIGVCTFLFSWLAVSYSIRNLLLNKLVTYVIIVVFNMIDELIKSIGNYRIISR